MRMRAPCPQRHLAPSLLALGLLFLLLLVGCSSGSGAAAPTATAGSATLPVQATSGGQPTATPQLTPITTPGGQVGGSAFCSRPASGGSTPLPASIPTYPNAQLHFGRSENGFGLYGLCTASPITAIVQFYTAQLPTKGWTQLQTNSLGDVEQVLATRNSAHVTITIQQDPQARAQNEIIIQTDGL
jgi:hypothetical protein